MAWGDSLFAPPFFTLNFSFSRRALTIQEDLVGPDHPDVDETLEAYAALLRQMGRADEAEPMESRAKSIRANK